MKKLQIRQTTAPTRILRLVICTCVAALLPFHLHAEGGDEGPCPPEDPPADPPAERAPDETVEPVPAPD